MLLEVLLAWSDQLDGNELETTGHHKQCPQYQLKGENIPSLLEAGDDGTNQPAL